MNPETTTSNSIPSLLRDLRDETTTLLRQEVALAKSEMKENVSRMGSHAAQIAIGGFVAYAGIIVLLIGIGHLLGALLIRAGLDEQVAQWLAPSIVGLIVAIIGWVMLSKAKSAMAHDDLAPKQTIDSLRENKQWAQSKLHNSP
jgi:predicted phage tail protein